jgi:hypothetical protein
MASVSKENANATMGMLEPTAVSPLNIVRMASSLALMGPSVNVHPCDNKMVQVERTINISDASPFQIAECESPESEHCERGQPTSDYAFCTNGGKCKSLIWHGEPHAGCICNPEFEGRHCQYREGTAPEEELDIAENKSHITAGYIFFIVLTVVVFGVAGILGHAYYANMKEKNQAQNDVHVDFDQSDKTGQMA